MYTVLIPQDNDSSTADAPQGWTPHAVPDGLGLIGISKLHSEFIKKISVKVAKIDAKVNEIERSANALKTEINRGTEKSIEIVGVFAAILALIIVDVSIIKSATTFHNAILLIAGMTLSLIAFAALIHYFFSGQNQKLKLAFWLPISLLSFLVLIGISDGISDSIHGWSTNVQAEPLIIKEVGATE